MVDLSFFYSYETVGKPWHLNFFPFRLYGMGKKPTFFSLRNRIRFTFWTKKSFGNHYTPNSISKFRWPVAYPILHFKKQLFQKTKSVGIIFIEFPNVIDFTCRNFIFQWKNDWLYYTVSGFCHYSDCCHKKREAENLSLILYFLSRSLKLRTLRCFWFS